MLPAPPRNALRGVEGGAAVGVIYFVNIFGPQGPHSRPPWLVSRPRLSARESIISSGYGPFKVFPQLSLSFSCSSGEATPSRLAMHPPWPPAPPPHRVPHRACPPCTHRARASLTSAPWHTVARRPAAPCLSRPRPAVQLSHHPDFCHPGFFPPPHKQNPWVGTRSRVFSPEPRPLAWGVTCREVFLLSAFPLLSSLRRSDI